jgi:ABC-type branched-subunit amino acid transport system substrate-binding protein
VALVDFVKVDRPDAKKLTGIFQNNPIGQDRAKVSEKRAKELGLEWIPALLYQSGAADFRTELQQVMSAGADAILTDIYDSDAPIIQRQLVELGMGDFSNTYSYNPGAYGTLEPNLIEGIKGLNYITGGTRAAAFNKKFTDANGGKLYTDAWSPPFYDMWIAAMAMNLANSLDGPKIRDAIWPASTTISAFPGTATRLQQIRHAGLRSVCQASLQRRQAGQHVRGAGERRRLPIRG